MEVTRLADGFGLSILRPVRRRLSPGKVRHDWQVIAQLLPEDLLRRAGDARKQILSKGRSCEKVIDLVHNVATAAVPEGRC